ncbi:hypothetical protein B1C78_14680 [Thioalkalivibrio denitrificans]|uniref:Recombinase family protein n=1 Tax=Thioalkalivibrio denitrificans TaxID=108003 RepID=A0A1V3NC39_9GAMM|nr:recombinase family protein [Thioalkalivibrio denitrificans]OOG22669.1 hypothetical protein B1C78_14680 [Thioalkalivibrio denitrificans]
MKIAIYARYSTDNQRQTSIDDQIRRCREVIQGLGLENGDVQVFSDGALSGTDKHLSKRQGFLALVDAWDRGELDLLVVDEVSRLSRDAVQLANLQRRIEQTGVRVVAADGLDTSQQQWQLSFGLVGLISQQSIRDTQHRVVRGMLGQLERGFMIATPPYGYQYERQLDDQGNRLGTAWRVDPEESKVVVQIYELRSKGTAYGEIARQLNEKGVEPPRPRKAAAYWRPATIRRMIGNTIYRGTFRWHGSKGRQEKVKRRKRDPEIREFERPHLRLVSDEIWYLCNEGRISRSRYGGGKHRFAGLVSCGQCGSTLTISTGGNAQAMYCAQCGQARRVGIDRRPMGYLSVTGLEHILTKAIDAIITGPILEERRRRLKQLLTQDVGSAIQAARLECERAARGCGRLLKAIRRQEGEDELLLNEYEEARREHQSLLRKLSELEKERVPVDMENVRRQLEVDPRDLIPRIWDSNRPVAEIRSLLARLFPEIVFEGKRSRHVADVRVSLSPGIMSALASNTEPMDGSLITLRFRLTSTARRPTVWTVDCIPVEDEQGASSALNQRRVG